MLFRSFPPRERAQASTVLMIPSVLAPALGPIIGGFLVSFLGGSKIQIGGPTGAFVVIVAGILARHGLSGLYMVTMMAGVLLLILGFTGLGEAVRFIPRPIVHLHEGHEVKLDKADLVVVNPLDAVALVVLVDRKSTRLNSSHRT